MDVSSPKVIIVLELQVERAVISVPVVGLCTFCLDVELGRLSGHPITSRSLEPYVDTVVIDLLPADVVASDGGDRANEREAKLLLSLRDVQHGTERPYLSGRRQRGWAGGKSMGAISLGNVPISLHSFPVKSARGGLLLLHQRLPQRQDPPALASTNRSREIVVRGRPRRGRRPSALSSLDESAPCTTGQPRNTANPKSLCPCRRDCPPALLPRCRSVSRWEDASRRTREEPSTRKSDVGRW